MSDLAQFTAQEFRSMLVSAPRAIASGAVTRDEAEERLQCWLAIACLCGAELPQLDRLLPHFRVSPVYRPKRGWQDEIFAEPRARADCAEAIRPRTAWRVELARALDAACDHDIASPRTQALQALADDLDERDLIASCRRLSAVAEPAALALAVLGFAVALFPLLGALHG